MVDLLDIARAKQSKLLKELEDVNHFISTAERLQREASKPSNSSNGGAVSEQDEELSNRQVVLNKCREIIKRRGPTQLRDLYAELTQAGIDPGSAKPKGMLSIMLSRSEDFETSENGWMLA